MADRAVTEERALAPYHATATEAAVKGYPNAPPSLLPERLELATPLARGPGGGESFGINLGDNRREIREPRLGACGRLKHVTLRLFD